MDEASRAMTLLAELERASASPCPAHAAFYVRLLIATGDVTKAETSAEATEGGNEPCNRGAGR